MTRYRDQQTTIFSELCSLIENDTSCVYDIPSLDEVEYSYLDSLLTAGTSK